MDEITVYGIALVPVIMGMVELLKRLGVPSKYSPIASVILGILGGFYYLAPGEPQKAVLFGLVAGLSAVGLYSGTKNTYQEFRNNYIAYARFGNNKKKSRNKNIHRSNKA